jgi:phage terminase large subunit-like protein
MFDEKDILPIEPAKVPQNLNWWAYVDLALGQNKRSNFNSVYPFAMDPKNGDYLYRDLLRVRELDQFLKELKTAMLEPKNRKVTWGIESVAFQTVIFNDFRKDKDLVTVRIRKVIPTESKEDRAQGTSIHSKEQPLKLVKANNNPVAIRELLDFPFGKEDDIVDSMTGGPYMMAKFGNVMETRIL